MFIFYAKDTSHTNLLQLLYLQNKCYAKSINTKLTQSVNTKYIQYLLVYCKRQEDKYIKPILLI